MNCTYTVQNCDGFFERHPALPWQDARQMLLGIDWQAKDREWQERIAARKSHCPFNVVFFQGKDSIRIYQEHGEWVLVCTYKWGLRRFFGWIYPMGLFDPILRALPWEEVEELLSLFFTGSRADVIAKLKTLDQGIAF